jgi:outer membrane protein assembly factor BamB
MSVVACSRKRTSVNRMALLTALATCWLAVCSMPAVAEDWPTYRHDAARSAVTQEQLAPGLALQWVFEPTHAPQPAWSDPAKEKARVRFDDAYHVVVAGDSAFFGSSADGKIYCLNAATGQIRWAAFTGGPVRVAPTLAKGRVYAGSDDGYAYCLDARDGSLIWKTAAAFRDERVLGNGKMISLWPVRTGVLVDKGVAYFGAGVFPHESTFLCAVNADRGALVWRNDTFGENGYKLEFGGISPQGALLASEESVYVPSGRAMPAAFDRKTGAFRYFSAPGGKVGGTWAMLENGRLIAGIESKRSYDETSGLRKSDAAYTWFSGLHLVAGGDRAYLQKFDELCALDRQAFEGAGAWRDGILKKHKELTTKLRNAKKKLDAAKAEAKPAAKKAFDTAAQELQDLNNEKQRVEDGVHRWRRPSKDTDALILAGDTLFLGGGDRVSAASAKTGAEVWQSAIDGRACGLAAANGRLFVSTTNGKVHCFAAGAGKGVTTKAPANPSPYPNDAQTALYEQAADQILAETGVTRGFCFVYGAGEGRLAYELAKRSDLHIVGIEPDTAKVQTAREKLDAAGLYGARVIIDHGSTEGALPYAAYFANLVVSDTMLTTGKPVGAAKELFRVLKPCGGVAFVGKPSGTLDLDAFGTWWSAPDRPEPETHEGDGAWAKIVRGPLEGAGAWTHQYADVANTACSQDMRVKGPLGVLWFGGPGPERMVERHARAAAPVAMDGRMFVPGENLVMAYDTYNGMHLWEREIPGALRVRVDSDMSHMALDSDGLYVAAYDECFRLDPATGETMKTYAVPARKDKAPRRWGYLACVDNTLFGSSAAPLAQDYATGWWKATCDEPGAHPDHADVANALAQPKDHNDRDYWSFQQRGAAWHPMTQFPAWGSVAAPQGAITSKIMASDTLFALDTETGGLRWEYAGKSIAHPAITIGDGLVFLADCAATPDQKAAAMAEREALIEKGVWEKEDIRYSAKHADIRVVVALDVQTGEKRWERIIDLTGCGGDRMGMAYRDGNVYFLGCFSNHDRRLFLDGKLTWRRITAISGKDGGDVWSRPLNYLRRPVIMNDRILVEPRACDLATGEILMRSHPLTAKQEEWEYVRPGHCCSATSACPNMFFLRGYFLWYFDIVRDQGMRPFGGIRPGCWINTIPANGLVLFPEASAGCTCSYPIRSTVVMQPRDEERTWSLCIQHGAMTPVQHMAVNFGAPADWRDEKTMWVSYPHVPSTSWQSYGLNFRLKEQLIDAKQGYFSQNFEGLDMPSTKKPWLFASGCRGCKSLELPLIGKGEAPGVYTVRLFFADAENTKPGERVFAVSLQGKKVLRRLDIVKEAGGPNIAVMKEFNGIRVEDVLRVEFEARDETSDPAQWPLINGIEVIRQDLQVAQK